MRRCRTMNSRNWPWPPSKLLAHRMRSWKMLERRTFDVRRSGVLHCRGGGAEHLGEYLNTKGVFTNRLNGRP